MAQLGLLSGCPGKLQGMLASGITVVTLDLLVYGYDSDICVWEKLSGGFNVLHM